METTFNQKLNHWLKLSCLGKKPRTQNFYSEIYKIISSRWNAPEISCADISEVMILDFAEKVVHFCPSRWNAIIAALKFISPVALVLKRKKARFKNFNPPDQSQFQNFLRECDAARNSHAGLYIRWLSFTGMRISESRLLKWENIFADRIEVPAAVAKNSQKRSIPHLPELGELLPLLRSLDDKDGFVLPRANPRKAIQTASRRAGLSGNMSFHCCRHFFATRSIQCGVDIFTLANWLGHKDKGATLSKFYFHLMTEHSLRMAAKVRIGTGP